MPLSPENLRKFSEKLRNLREFPKTSETLQSLFLKTFWKRPDNFLKIFGILGIFWKITETVQNGFKIFGKFSEVFEKSLSFRKSSENFGIGSKLFFRSFFIF